MAQWYWNLDSCFPRQISSHCPSQLCHILSPTLIHVVVHGPSALLSKSCDPDPANQNVCPLATGTASEKED